MLRFGPYEVRDELGRGGMGIVYRGFDPIIRREVALKTIKLYDIGEEGERRQMQERLEREAQSAGRLSHPNIVTIYQVGYAELRPGEMVAFIAMEYVPGRTLAAVLEKTRATNVPMVLKILRQAAEGLDYAHQQGVIHRDVKPANMLLTADGRLKITDFGVAKLVSHTMTMTGTVLGSPFYMSPEQIRAERVDGRSDQYALAVVAYEVFGGRKPFQAETLSALVYKIAHEDPPKLVLDSEALAGRLNPVLQRAMAKEPDARYPSCVALVEALERACAEPEPVVAARLAETQPVTVKPAPRVAPVPAPAAAPAQPGPAPAPARKLPWPAIAAAAGVLVLIAGLAGALKHFSPTPASTPQGQPAAQAVTQPAAPEAKPTAEPELPRVVSREREAPVAPPNTVTQAPQAAKPAAERPVIPPATASAPPKPEPPPVQPAPEPARTEAVKTATAGPEPPAPAREPVRTAPKLLERAAAPYTNEARAAGIEGAVHLSVDIDERGIPVRARVLKPLDPGLDSNAIRSLGGWRFQPATEDGKPVGSTANIEIQFRLVGAPTKQRPTLKGLKP
jgi:TonB family protein